jgi:hypothetical protein
VPRSEPCEGCGGTGWIEKPTLTESLARHLAVAPTFGLQLSPAELTELAAALGITQEQIDEIRRAAYGAPDAGPV